MCKLKRGVSLAALLGALLPCAACGGAELDLQLRVTWGGARRMWQGAIQVSQGTIAQPRSLGIEADAPPALELAGGVLRFWPPCPTSFDGWDLHVTAPEDAKLIIELSADRQAGSLKRLEVPLADFVTQQDFAFESPLDEGESRVLVCRAPGDELRIDLPGDCLVFAPGEVFTFLVRPQRPGLPTDSAMRCGVQLRPSGETRELWREQFDVRVLEGGTAEPVGPLQVTLPAQEGVYDLVVSLSQRRFPEAIVRSRVLVQRSVQLVVIGDRVGAPAPVDWREVDTVDLTSREWWDRWMWLPQLKRLPGLDRGAVGIEKEVRGNAAIQTREHLGRQLTQIGPEKWYAAPLRTARPGEPHVFELEYPNDVRQTLGISIVAPDAAGRVTPLGLDSGVDVADRPKPAKAQLEKHRLLFWPRTKTPWVLLTNRRKDAPALVGQMRVLAGPAALPESPWAGASVRERMLAVYYDKPFFPENFSAPDALDEPTQQSLDDWNTFYQGSRRLIEYLKYAGYNAAVVSVVRDGGCLYPSRLLHTTPKYDSGAFFSNGQDPLPKDVLELMFRLFDREGLQLVPAIHFGVPLPELEEMLRRGGPAADGIELLGLPDGAPQPVRGRDLSRRGAAPYYNPLDARVQAAMQRVVKELADRYSHHPSFAGLCLQMGPDTYVQLPDEGWPCDDQSMGRFQRETGVKLPGEAADKFLARSRFLRGEGREPWLAWRAQQLAAFFQSTRRTLADGRPDARLYLATADLVTSPVVQQAFRPRLLGRPDISAVLLRQGIDAAAYREDGSVVLLRPQRTAPLTSLVAQAVNVELARSPSVDAVFRRNALAGALNYHEPLTLRLAEFDQRSPFGADRTYTWLAAHVPCGGAQNRARFVHSLAAMDVQVLLEGGWMVPLGQEESLRSVFEVYRRLPAAPFQSCTPKSPSASGSDVVVRTLARGNRTHVYVVNDSPWDAVVGLELGASGRCSLQSLDSRPLPPPALGEGGLLWTLEMAPYDVIGAVFQAPDLSVKDWRVSYHRDVEGELNDMLSEVRARADELRHPQPISSLANPDFEALPQRDEVPGWSFSQRPGVLVRTEAAGAKQGRRCLHMRVDAPGTVAWVRSRPFPPPRTGRVFVLAWIRTRDQKKQPPLRLAIDGLVNGEPYYRFAPLGVDVDRQGGRGGGSKTQPLPETWNESPFLLPIDDLPATGMTELLVGFDLMGPGEVWIDDVQVFDLYFQENEQDVLAKDVAMADLHLGAGKICDCARFLDSYWPRFLLEYVPPPTRMASVASPARAAKRTVTDNKRPKTADKTSAWNRFLPRIPWRSPLKNRN